MDSGIKDFISNILHSRTRRINRNLYIDHVLRSTYASENKYIIVSGMPRSGTSLLSAMLNVHDELYAPSEYPLLVKEEFNSDIIALKCEYFGKNARQIRSELKKYGWGRFIENSIYQALKSNEASYFVTKSLLYNQYFQDIKNYCPNSRWILMVRDGRDVSISLMKYARYLNVPDPNLSFEQAIKIWLRFANYVIDLKNRPECLIVKYEDLILETQETIKNITNHIGVPFLPEMCEHHNQDFSDRSDVTLAWHQNLAKPIIGDNVGKWKNILTKEQDKYFISVASKEMIQLGYF